MHKALSLEPLAKTINPVIGWQTLLPHAEAMTALRIDVQFDRVASGPPCTIQGQTWIYSQFVIIGKSDKQWRRIGWKADLFPQSAIDRGREIGTALCIVLKCYTGGDSAARGETHHANPIRGNPPLRSTAPYYFHGLLSIGYG